MLDWSVASDIELIRSQGPLCSTDHRPGRARMNDRSVTAGDERPFPTLYLETKDRDKLATLLEAINIKRKTVFEFENTPYSCMDSEISTPTARGGQTLVR